MGFWLILPHHGPSLKAVRAGTQTGRGPRDRSCAEAVEDGYLLSCPSWLAKFLENSGLPVQGSPIHNGLGPPLPITN